MVQQILFEIHRVAHESWLDGARLVQSIDKLHSITTVVLVLNAHGNGATIPSGEDSSEQKNQNYWEYEGEEEANPCPNITTGKKLQVCDYSTRTGHLVFSLLHGTCFFDNPAYQLDENILQRVPPGIEVFPVHPGPVQALHCQQCIVLLPDSDAYPVVAVVVYVETRVRPQVFSEGTVAPDLQPLAGSIFQDYAFRSSGSDDLSMVHDCYPVRQ